MVSMINRLIMFLMIIVTGMVIMINVFIMFIVTSMLIRLIKCQSWGG